jgi:oxalyl-CoA decarboxylase
VYRGDEANHKSSDPAPSALSQSSHYEPLIEGFGGNGYHAELTSGLTAAMDTPLTEAKPAVSNGLIDPKAGTGSRHLKNLTTESSLSSRERAQFRQPIAVAA